MAKKVVIVWGSWLTYRLGVLANTEAITADPTSIRVADDLYSVTELGRDLGVSARTIRLYEAKGLISPCRAGNNRVYTNRDRSRMILILRGKRLGFSLREIKEYLDLYEVDPTHAKQLRLLLKSVASRIQRLEEQRIALDQTLDELREVAAQAQAALVNLGVTV